MIVTSMQNSECDTAYSYTMYTTQLKLFQLVQYLNHKWQMTKSIYTEFNFIQIFLLLMLCKIQICFL